MFVPCLIAFLLFQSTTEPKPAALEGTVIHAASKTPIRKAKVTLTGIGFEGGGSVESGDDGKFAFKDVKPGRYRVSAEKTGYETTGYGARKPGEGVGQVLRVDAGAALTGLDIGLAKQGVIAGKILDANSEPVNRALVMALTNMYYQSGRRARIPRGAIPVFSNDLGEYRIGQLPPGKYIVCAIPAAFYQPTPPGGKETKPATEEIDITSCFPNAPQMSEATQLEIRDSTEIPSVDVRLIKGKTVTVQGHITGVPAGAGAITILNLNTKTSGPMGNVIHPRTIVQSSDGKFEFKNVPPGSYVLHTLPTGLGNTPFVVKSEVEIGDKPVTDLDVPAVVPFELKAKINAEPGPELKLPSVRLILTAADEITPAIAMATATADGDVTLANIVPGRHRITIMGVPETHYVREIRVGDQTVEGEEVDIPRAGTQLTLALAIGRAEITGVAKNEKGDAVPGAHVALIPKPHRAFRQRSARTDQNGVFKLSNVPPGEYYLAAFDTVEPGSLEDDEFLKPILSKMKTVKVQDGGSDSQSLTVLAGAGDGK